MNALIHFSVFNRAIVLTLTALLIVVGVLAFRGLPIDAVPDITNTQVQINANIEGLAPEEIERAITFPVETAMRGLPGVELVRSLTRFGLSQVTIVFADEVDVYRARQLVSERLQSVSAQLPKGVVAKLGPTSTGLGEIVHYALDVTEPAEAPEARFKQLVEIRALQDWYVKPRLMTVAGVADVNTSGGFERQYHVQPDIQKLRRLGLRFEDLNQALAQANRNVGGGYITQGEDQFLVQGIGLFKTIADIEEVPIKQLDSFRLIKIKDVARVRLGRELRTGAAVVDGREAVFGTVLMLLGENSRTVATRVGDKLNEIGRSLPRGFTLKALYSRSDLVNQTLRTVEHNLILGAGLVIVVLFALIGNARAAVITAVTIPLSLLATFAVMRKLGISGNLMSLGALDFGIIVDGTVILIDNCVRHIHEARERLARPLTAGEVQRAVYDASVEVRVAAGFGELIVVAVFLPIFGLVGVEGKMFHPMAATFAIAVVCALALSFTVAPALASLVLTGHAADAEPRLMGWLKDGYGALLDRALRFRRSVLIGAIGLVAVGLVLFLTRGAEFLPQLNEGAFAFSLARPVDVSLDHSLAVQRQTDAILKEFPEVDTVFSRIGTSEIATDPMGVNAADTYVTLKDRRAWPGGRGRHTHESLIAAMLERLRAAVPGQSYLASQPIQTRFNELLEGTRADVAVKVFGPDLATNLRLAREIQTLVKNVRGAGDVEVDLAGTSPVLKIEPSAEQLSRYNANVGDLLGTVSTALGGTLAGYFFEGERRFPILVRLADEDRANLDTVRALPVGIGLNTTAPLSALARITMEQTYGSIVREDSNRRSAILVNLRGRDVEGFVAEAQSVIARDVKLPDGYYLQWGGNFKNLGEARARLLILAPVSLILVALMIYFAFGSFGQTLLILSCVPFALVGGVVGLCLMGLPFSVSAGVGFIALSGIAVLNGVVLINFFNSLAATGLTGTELVRTGASLRLRPVLMTALVAIFGFVPMLLSREIGAEVQRPLASVVIGGILSSTALTLIVLPLLFVKWGRRPGIARVDSSLPV